jgi:hypothetical protein
MRVRTVLLAIAFCLAAAMACFAADANVGTWKLNEAKSKIPAGAPKNVNIVYTAEGDQYKCVIDGVDGSGKPTHNEWTGKFDGKDYKVTGAPDTDMRSIQMVDKSHYKVATKKDGKTNVTGTVVFSADGKTRTLTTNSTDAKGKKVTATYVYDKQ